LNWYKEIHYEHHASIQYKEGLAQKSYIYINVGKEVFISIPYLVYTLCEWQLEGNHQYSAAGLAMQELWLSNLMLCNWHSVEELDSAIKNEYDSC